MSILRVPSAWARDRPRIRRTSIITIAAEVEIPPEGAGGVLVCCGGLAGGFTVFIKDGKLHWEHNYYNEVYYRVSSAETIPPGRQVLSAEVTVDEQGKFGGGKVTLRLGRKVIGEGRFEKQVAGFFTANEQYESPFPFKRGDV